jgi:elongation factor P
MASATDIRKGTVLIMDGQLFICTDFAHATPGNLRGRVQTKLRNLKTGQIIDRKFSSDERIETAYLDKRACEYLYKDGKYYVFMDQSNFEQYMLEEAIVGEQMGYIVPNSTVQVTFYETTPVSIDLPGTVELKVTETDPGVRGDTVSNVFKPATLETGLQIKVPNHISVGDVVRISTSTGEFQGRSKG